mgnify:CR=1 FL=1
MPTIRPYIQDESALAGIPGRRASGDDFGGSGLQLLGHAIGDEPVKAAIAFEEAKSREEVTDAQTKLAEFGARKTLEMDELARTTDLERAKEFSSSFNDRLQPELQKLGDSYETRAGQQAFQRGAGEVSGYFLKQAGLAQAHMMGMKAKQNWLSFENASRNAVLGNPLDYERQKRLMVETLNDPNGLYFGHLTSEERAVMTRTAVENLAESAVRGVIRLGGEGAVLAKKQLVDGTWDPDLNAEAKERMLDLAEVGVDREHTKQERERLMADRLVKDRNDAIEADFTRRILDPRSQGAMPTDEEIAKSDLPGPQQRVLDGFKMQRLRELASLEEDKKHPQEVKRLLTQLIADGDDPEKQYNLDKVKASFIKGTVSTAEYLFLEERFNRLKDGSANTFERDLNSLIGRVDRQIGTSVYFAVNPAAAADAMARIQADAYATAERLRKKNEDPRQMLDPKSSEFFFSQENLSIYMKVPAQALAEGAAAVTAEAEKLSIGTIRNGYKYLGGDPAKKESWAKIQGEAAGKTPNLP